MGSMLVHGGPLTDVTPAHRADNNYEVDGQDHFGDWAGQVSPSEQSFPISVVWS
jgi:hypothetical protein